MKPFTLDPVLRYRKQKEELAQQELFRARQEEAAIESDLIRARRVLDQLIQALAQEKAQGITADRLALFDNRIGWEKQRIRELDDRLNQQRRVVARRRRRLLQASQERKALDKLKERQNRAYKQYKDKQELIMIDEIAVLRHER